MAKVLIVDDDKETRFVLSELLKDEGFHVNVARNGFEALDILKHEGEWVVLLDVKMPEIDGYEVVRKMRENPAWLDDNRVVLMSAGRKLTTEEHASMSDVVLAIVPKPFEVDSLLELLQQVASGKETSRE